MLPCEWSCQKECKCEEIDPTFLLTQDIYCYALNTNGRILDTTTPKPEPRTTTVTTRTTIGRIETTEYLSTTVEPSLQPPEEITDDVTSTDRKDLRFRALRSPLFLNFKLFLYQ